MNNDNMDKDIYFQSGMVQMTKPEWDAFVAEVTPIIAQQMADSLDNLVIAKRLETFPKKYTRGTQ